MSGIVGSIALGAVAGKVKRAASAVPWQVWAGLALCLAVFIGFKMHERRVAAYGSERFMAGYAKAVEDGRQLKEQAELIGESISNKLKGQNDETNRRIDRLAGDLRLLGPGKASARCAPVSVGAGQSKPPSGTGDAAGAEVPPADRDAIVPWAWLVERAEQCDLNRAEVLTWREWWELQTATRGTQP